jgi:hypothetical protein
LQIPPECPINRSDSLREDVRAQLVFVTHRKSSIPGRVALCATPVNE